MTSPTLCGEPVMDISWRDGSWSGKRAWMKQQMQSEECPQSCRPKFPKGSFHLSFVHSRSNPSQTWLRGPRVFLSVFLISGSLHLSIPSSTINRVHRLWTKTATESRGCYCYVRSWADVRFGPDRNQRSWWVQESQLLVSGKCSQLHLVVDWATIGESPKVSYACIRWPSRYDILNPSPSVYQDRM